MRKHHGWIEQSCTTCGAMVKRAKSRLGWDLKNRRKDLPQYTGKRMFCNRKCFGSWLGKNYGFKRSKNPVEQENA